ncbi:MAG: response regulator [candidate division Zixibacteria bacterium]|nr:response regulator [candidate division Zixibacteria bacterium]
MKQTVLIVDDDRNLRYALRRILEPNGYMVEEAGSAEEALDRLDPQRHSIVFMDLRMTGMSGLEGLKLIREIDTKIPVIIMTAFGTTELAIEAVKLGAYDFILKPFEVDDIVRLTEQASNAYRLMTRRVDMVQKPAPESQEADTLIGRSRPMQEVYKQIGRVAQSSATVLIRGASGTGKELVARAIYHHSNRNAQPFLAVNCAAIPEGLLESELFGHERGAFTSAEHRRIGKFERAHGGTLFLDEIGDMSTVTQAKILRVLQDGVIERVGGNEPIHVDARIIAATHRDLAQMIDSGGFREDLFFRLNVFTIELPSLDERKDDIPLLVQYFVARGNQQLGKSVTQIPDETISKLSEHNWRGNVRELENVIGRALIITNGPTLLPESIQFGDEVQPVQSPDGEVTDEELLDRVFSRLAHQFDHESGDPILATLEREMLSRAMEREQGNQVHAAKLLGMSRQTLRNRLSARPDSESEITDEDQA